MSSSQPHELGVCLQKATPEHPLFAQSFHGPMDTDRTMSLQDAFWNTSTAAWGSEKRKTRDSPEKYVSRDKSNSLAMCKRTELILRQE